MAQGPPDSLLAARLRQLRHDPERFPWPERIALVRELFSGRVRPLSATAAELLRALAADSKWEVRKDVADHLHKLSEPDFNPLAALLMDDENAFVANAAGRALDRRRRGGARNQARSGRGPDSIEVELRQIEARQGPAVSNMIRDMAARFYDHLVGASVHEMRSILTAMKGSVEHIERAPASDMGATTLKITPRLKQQVAFLERLLDDMRDYTRPPTRERATERVADLIREAVQMVGDEFRAAGRDASPVQIQVDVPEELTVAVSRMQIILALRNVIKNANEAFMADETRFRPGAVWIAASGCDDGVSITVRDSGIGLFEEELEAIRQFVPGRTSKSCIGTGFGLPIAWRTVRAHGGNLTIESRAKEGTIVSIWLPESGLPEPPESEPEEPAQASKPVEISRKRKR